MKIRLLFSLLFVSLLSISANSKVDSLLNILDKESNDTLRLRVNVALSAEYIKTDLKQALEYNSNSLELAKKMNHPREIAAAYHRYAYIYSKLDQKEKATEYYLMSARILEKEGTDFDLAAINNSLGLLMMESDERQKALNYYNKALAYASNEKHSKIKAGILNNIGSVYLREKNDSLALSLFQSAVNLNVQNGNADWLANNYANIARVYQKKGSFDTAFYYMSLFKNIKDSLGNLFEIASADLILGSHFFKSGDYVRSKEFFLRSFEKSEELKAIEIISKSAYGLSEVLYQEGRYKEACDYFKIHKEHFDQVNDHVQLQTVAKLEAQYEFEKEKAMADIKYQRTVLLYSVIIGSLLLLLIIIYQRQQKIRLEKKKLALEKENIQLENLKLENDLDFKNREMTTTVMSLVERNELIKSIRSELDEAKHAFSRDNKKFVQGIINRLLLSNNEDLWEEFKIRFTSVHPGFYDKLDVEYPDLTPNERRLCAFLKLNMNTKDISALTGQSVKSIEVARTRLRKKLNIANTETNLVAFLAKY